MRDPSRRKEGVARGRRRRKPAYMIKKVRNTSATRKKVLCHFWYLDALVNVSPMMFVVV